MSEALKLQMEVQKRLHEQLEVIAWLYFFTFHRTYPYESNIIHLYVVGWRRKKWKENMLIRKKNFDFKTNIFFSSTGDWRSLD